MSETLAKSAIVRLAATEAVAFAMNATLVTFDISTVIGVAAQVDPTIAITLMVEFT